MTYTIDRPEDYSTFTGTITDAVTGRVWGIFGMGKFALNEPLCEGCDAPVSDGPCGCEEAA